MTSVVGSDTLLHFKDQLQHRQNNRQKASEKVLHQCLPYPNACSQTAGESLTG